MWPKATTRNRRKFRERENKSSTVTAAEIKWHHALKKNKTGSAASAYLTQVAGDAYIVPGIVIELAIDGLHQGLKGPRAQIYDQPHCAALQRKVHVVGRLPGVQHEAVTLQGAERESDLVRAALDGGHRQVVAEELVAFEGSHRLILTCR